MLMMLVASSTQIRVLFVTYLTANELDIMRALGVAVASAVFGTRLVVGLGRHATVRSHFGEVDGTVETATEVRHIDVEGELLALQLEELIGIILAGREEVHTGANVGTGDELERQRVTRSCDTVSARVVSTIKSAVLGAGSTIRAERRVPLIAGVAYIPKYELSISRNSEGFNVSTYS
jgi:hypothetical protein